MRGQHAGHVPLALCLWPGLPHLWIEGAWSGLVLAFGFTCLLNLLLLTSLHWTGWLDRGLQVAGWTAIGVVWSVSAVSARRWTTRRTQSAADDGARDLFPQALGEYLKGNWYEAEMVCQGLLRRGPGDVEARLLLATLLRRTRRFSEARGHLDRLGRLETASGWQHEIADEWERLAEAEAEAIDSPTASAALDDTALDNITVDSTTLEITTLDHQVSPAMSRAA